ELCAIDPLHSFLDRQPKVRFMNEIGSAECMVAPLTAQIACRTTPQIIVNDRQHAIASVQVSTGPCAEQRRHAMSAGSTNHPSFRNPTLGNECDRDRRTDTLIPHRSQVKSLAPRLARRPMTPLSVLSRVT